MIKTTLSLAVMVFLALFAYEWINTHVFIVDGMETLGCLTNRCVNVNDTTILIRD